jgi:hypothetical protein
MTKHEKKNRFFTQDFNRFLVKLKTNEKGNLENQLY